MQRWHLGVGRQSPTALYSHSELWRLSWYSLHGRLFPQKALYFSSDLKYFSHYFLNICCLLILSRMPITLYVFVHLSLFHGSLMLCSFSPPSFKICVCFILDSFYCYVLQFTNLLLCLISS